MQYDGQSNGLQLNVSKDLGDFVVGVALGYQQSDVRYNGKYNGVSEDIKSYQVGTQRNVQRERTHRCGGECAVRY